MPTVKKLKALEDDKSIKQAKKAYGILLETEDDA
jgi:hypothetical protein